jgi:predicted O-methyltransferase YrrM
LDSVEGNEQFVEIAKDQAAKSNCPQIQFHHQDFSNFLKSHETKKYDFIMLDGDHTEEATLKYADELLHMLKDNGVFAIG